MRFVTSNKEYTSRKLKEHGGLVKVALVILMLPGAALCQTAGEQITHEITRLSKAADAKPQSNVEWKQIGPYVTSTLVQARSSLDARRMYGAPPDLHEQVGRVIDLALKGATSGGR